MLAVAQKDFYFVYTHPTQSHQVEKAVTDRTELQELFLQQGEIQTILNSTWQTAIILIFPSQLILVHLFCNRIAVCSAQLLTIAL